MNSLSICLSIHLSRTFKCVPWNTYLVIRYWIMFDCLFICFINYDHALSEGQNYYSIFVNIHFHNTLYLVFVSVDTFNTTFWKYYFSMQIYYHIVFLCTRTLLNIVVIYNHCCVFNKRQIQLQCQLI